MKTKVRVLLLANCFYRNKIIDNIYKKQVLLVQKHLLNYYCLSSNYLLNLFTKSFHTLSTESNPVPKYTLASTDVLSLNLRNITES